MAPLNRRELVKAAGALAGAAIGNVPSHRRARAITREADPPVLDVAIVGGGVAGAYCTWRLSQPDAATCASKNSSLRDVRERSISRHTRATTVVSQPP